MQTIRVAFVSLIVTSLCSAALAGDISVTVTYRGAPATGVKVALTPGGSSQNTDAAGKCVFARPRVGTYSVLAQKIIGGVQVAWIKDGVVVPAGAGVVSVSLGMVGAVRFSPYVPLKTGNKWVYDESISGAGATKTETVTGTAAVSGASVSVIEATRAGSADLQKRFWRVGSDGLTMYGEMEGADMRRWLPWVNVPDLLPLSFKRATSYTVHHSDGSPDDPMTMEYTYVGLENVTVPAGMIRDCVKLGIKMSKAGIEVGTMYVWFGKGIGIVKQIENKPAKTVTKLLRSYSVVP